MAKAKNPRAVKQRGNSAKAVAKRPSFKPGNEHAFKPGDPRINRAGRPKSLTLSEAYRRMLGTVDPDDPEGRTHAEVIAESMVIKAKKGTVMASMELADRTEGRPMQTVGVFDMRQLMEKAKESGIDINSDPVLAAIFAASGVGPTGGSAD